MCGCGDTRNIHAAAAMCATCPRLENFTTCTIDGLPALSRACPLGKHPDAENVVRWCDLEWIGVPAPIRWALRLRWFRRIIGAGSALRTDLIGCGCVKALKEAIST